MASALPNNPAAFISHIQSSKLDKPDAYRSLKEQMPDIEPMFEALKDVPDVQISDIENYLGSRAESLNTFDAHIQSIVRVMHSADVSPNEKIAAEHRLLSLASYISQRNQVFQNAEMQLDGLSQKVKSRGMAPEQEVQIDPANVTGRLKEGFSAVFDGFKNAKNGTDKAILLAGVAASVILASKFLFAKNSLSRSVRNIGGSIAGIYLLYMSYKVIDRSYMLTRGKPLLNLTNEQPAFYTKEQWDEKMYREQLQNAVATLRTEKHLDDAFISKMLNVTGAEDTRYVKAIMNFGTMSVREYLDVYQRGMSDESVSDADWPDYPLADSTEFPQHNLSPKERFLIMKEIGQTTGLIDAKGAPVSGIDKDISDQSVFYKMMNQK